MGLKEQLDQNLREALKAGQKIRVQTLRSLKSAIKYAEIEAGKALDDEQALAVLAKQAKQRRDSIAEFEKAQRRDLIEQETAELAIIEAYLPAQLPAEEIERRLKAIIAELGISDLKGMGQVMSRAMVEFKGQAEGKLINQIARQLLSGSGR
jgi:hypothetical protein